MQRPCWLVLLALAPLGAAACQQPAPIVERRYVPYEGEAYPDRRSEVVIPPGGIGIVSDLQSDTLSVIDLASGERTASYPVGRDPIGLDGPYHVAADPKAGAVYVALSYPLTLGTGPHAAHLSGTQFGYVQKLALDNLRILGQVRVGPAAGDLVISGDGKRLVLSHFDLLRAAENPDDLDAARASLSIIDPGLIEPVYSDDPERIRVCVAPQGVALSRPDGARAFVACYGEDALAVANLDDPSLPVERVPVGDAPSGFPAAPSYGPFAASLSPDGAVVAVTNTVSRDVRFFDVASGSFGLHPTLKVPGIPFFPAWSADGARLYVPTQQPDALVVVDVKNGSAELAQRLFTKAECELPHVVEVASAARVFVVCEGDHQARGRVLALDATTLETLSTAEVGVFPSALIRVGGGAP